ncbi:MAG: phosphoglycerate kinase, partial [Bacteroidota bacterium]
QKVLTRVDFNVPLDKAFNITDDTRMQKALPTLKHILDNEGALIIMSHLGRPQKKKKEDGSIDVERFTLRHLVDHLSSLLEVEVQFAVDCVGEEASTKAAQLKSGEVLLLENTRFHPEEAKGEAHFAAALASLADIYINDAFGTAHRAHASTTTVAQYFEPSHKSFGFLIQNELENANKALNSKEHPFTAVVGGAKVSDKIMLLENLMERADNIIVGGAMAYTFIKAIGGKVGNSLVEEDRIEQALKTLELAEKSKTRILLPQDSVVAEKFSEEGDIRTVDSDNIKDGWMGLDIGPQARIDFTDVIKESKVILWNGPMGVFEMDSFSKGTFAIARAMSEATEQGAFTLIGGGDSVAAINKSGLDDEVSFISTGGGAMLEYLEGKVLPGIAAITS